jgi:hypothetical protein
MPNTPGIERTWYWDHFRLPQTLIDVLMGRSKPAEGWRPPRLANGGIPVRQIQLSKGELELYLEKHVNSPGCMYAHVESVMSAYTAAPGYTAVVYIRGPLPGRPRLDFTMAALAVWGPTTKKRRTSPPGGPAAKKQRTSPPSGPAAAAAPPLDPVETRTVHLGNVVARYHPGDVPRLADALKKLTDQRYAKALEPVIARMRTGGWFATPKLVLNKGVDDHQKKDIIQTIRDGLAKLEEIAAPGLAAATAENQKLTRQIKVCNATNAYLTTKVKGLEYKAHISQYLQYQCGLAQQMMALLFCLHEVDLNQADRATLAKFGRLAGAAQQETDAKQRIKKYEHASQGLKAFAQRHLNAQVTNVE